MPTPISPEGYEALRAQIHHLETVEMPRIAQLIAEARAEGDLKENSEYHGQRENQGQLQAKINLLREKLADAIIVDRNAMPKDVVAFGARVTVRDIDADVEEVYEFVGPGEEDYMGEVMKILCTSPVGAQLMNRKVGDRVQVEVPSGTISYEVIAID